MCRLSAPAPPAQDTNDNELVYFESIHLFVELLDQFFGNVCELDLVFNFNKVRSCRACWRVLALVFRPHLGARSHPLAPPHPQVYMILDEFFLAGEVQETSKQTILHRVQDLDKLE